MAYAFKNINEEAELYYDYSYDINSMIDWNKEYNMMMEKNKKNKWLYGKKYENFMKVNILQKKEEKKA